LAGRERKGKKLREGGSFGPQLTRLRDACVEAKGKKGKSREGERKEGKEKREGGEEIPGPRRCVPRRAILPGRQAVSLHEKGEGGEKKERKKGGEKREKKEKRKGGRLPALEDFSRSSNIGGEERI